MKRFSLIVVLAAASAAIVAAQQTNEVQRTEENASNANSCPLHAEHMKQQASADDRRFAEMNERGARAMGFDQAKTTHHFRILPDGGVIEVTVNDAADTADLNAIRAHFTKIAHDFAEGNFTAPVMTHGEMPPGADTMRALRDKITYRYEELPTGARVRITMSDAEALHAVHEFFTYQIREHRTGDSQAN